MISHVALLDYGAGNLRSAQRALERVGAQVTITANPLIAAEADGLLVPGVGAFAACMQGLESVGGPDIIAQRVAAQRPVLGICVGMQVLFESGTEHGTQAAGCGQWPGVVERLQAPVLPHMGWNTVDIAPGSVMFAGLPADERFYFVHSYGVRQFQLESADTPVPAVSWTSYGGDRCVAAVEHAALWATQFHPEKSGDAGAALLRNWLQAF
ncbi:imidazole glycerol phosphate synthase subunit HisH [Corynebacterium lizhenjunii]|uniref:imidazole glycerol phosphate synthase subunit HisH n=1 Tax=Corynebacterium lizhenjunii TaxID=2709394 RepID=UPI0013EDEA2D|nr:imidazole glycerol phosphate synthase subunit HisH [Corynebacterium lizhenjunii]